MRAWFQRFMTGRYGTDTLNRFMSLCTLVLLVLYFLFRWSILYTLAIVLLFLTYFRTLSRNIDKRYAENVWFNEKTAGAQKWLRTRRTRWQQRSVYRYFRCPRCRQELRVPRGRGNIAITCPKCHTEFVKKS